MFLKNYNLLLQLKRKGLKKNFVSNRSSLILKEFVGFTFKVHQGNRFIDVKVSEDMVGYRFGDFSPT
jgi:small subunit ribosomal protein S19